MLYRNIALLYHTKCCARPYIFVKTYYILPVLMMRACIYVLIVPIRGARCINIVYRTFS